MSPPAADRRPGAGSATTLGVPALALALALASGPSLALKADRSKPMDIQADSLETRIDEGRATLSGNVRITQGSMAVAAARAVVSQNDRQQVTRAVLEGAPATLAQDLDDGGRLDARARVIDYDVAAGVVVLTGAVEIDQPRGSLRGERITYDLNTGQLTGGGDGVPGRVSLRINPKPAAPPAD
jgi:lipopolysaccharide export system protein LptA